jgi:hypothetical protein
VWVARNRFAVLDKYGAISIKNLKNETVRLRVIVRPLYSTVFTRGTPPLPSWVLDLSPRPLILKDARQYGLAGEKAADCWTNP